MKNNLSKLKYKILVYQIIYLVFLLSCGFLFNYAQSINLSSNAMKVINESIYIGDTRSALKNLALITDSFFSSTRLTLTSNNKSKNFIIRSNEDPLFEFNIVTEYINPEPDGNFLAKVDFYVPMYRGWEIILLLWSCLCFLSYIHCTDNRQSQKLLEQISKALSGHQTKR